MEAPPAGLLDCAIIGGGPAGLTAALYLARYGRDFVVIDSGDSRAGWIPESHNIPLFTEGIGGREILKRQREHAEAYGARLMQGEATALCRTGAGFEIGVSESGGKAATLSARFVLLATGVSDIPPKIPNVADAVQRGLIRYCPICDGYEAKGKRVGVIGVGDRGLGEAVFIARTYRAEVTLLSFDEPPILTVQQCETLARYRIRLVTEPIASLSCDGGKIGAHGDARYEFDTLYSALGVQYRSGLATALGAASDECGALSVGEHSETTAPGLYAAGDVTQGLNQIVAGMGQAAKAATHIHNRL
jgi:thioredoxin reductase (NADPH)